MAAHKIIHDSVHGGVRFEGVFLSLLEAPELQRLHSIHQLGLAYLVYPGANHTRFEHSLGAYAVAKRVCKALSLDPEESKLIECAALLHDVGHLPFSHTLEFVLHDQFGVDHEDLSRRLIEGRGSVMTESETAVIGKIPSIPEILERHGIEPKAVAALLRSNPGPSPQRTLSGRSGQAHFNGRRYQSQLISGPVDVDQLDYLERDAHYTGVAYGVIDLDRLVETMQIFNGDLVVDRGGLSAIEGMLVARALMFSAVYFHKTVRIAELMLAKSVEEIDEQERERINVMTDSSLLSHLAGMEDHHRETAVLIKYRRLFKKVYSVRTAELEEDQWELIDSLGSVKKRRSAEEEIAMRAGVPPQHVLIDTPSSELDVSEPRMSLTDVRILEDERVRMLTRISSIAASLQIRRPYEYAVMVACPEKDKQKVSRAAKRVLGI